MFRSTTRKLAGNTSRHVPPSRLARAQPDRRRSSNMSEVLDNPFSLLHIVAISVSVLTKYLQSKYFRSSSNLDSLSVSSAFVAFVEPKGVAMEAASRPYVMAAAALAATGMVAVTPLASKAAEVAAQLPVVSMATKLVDAEESLANVPINLFDDLVNIPANELYATQFFTDNLLMAGPWSVVSPTNLWGVDPGDPTHFMSVVNFALPFTALNGMDSPETDFSAGLGQQVWGFVASELPTSASCDELDCAPFEPTSPITGVSWEDFYIWVYEIATGQEKQDLFANWFDTAYNSNGTYYFDPSNPGSVDPS